jgi:hypothetical protein
MKKLGTRTETMGARGGATVLLPGIRVSDPDIPGEGSNSKFEGSSV